MIYMYIEKVCHLWLPYAMHNQKGLNYNTYVYVPFNHCNSILGGLKLDYIHMCSLVWITVCVSMCNVCMCLCAWDVSGYCHAQHSVQDEVTIHCGNEQGMYLRMYPYADVCFVLLKNVWNIFGRTTHTYCKIIICM